MSGTLHHSKQRNGFSKTKNPNTQSEMSSINPDLIISEGDFNTQKTNTSHESDGSNSENENVNLPQNQKQKQKKKLFSLSSTKEPAQKKETKQRSRSFFQKIRGKNLKKNKITKPIENINQQLQDNKQQQQQQKQQQQQQQQQQTLMFNKPKQPMIRKRIKKKRETVKFEEPINYEEEDYDPFIEDHIGDPKAVALVDYTAKRNTELSFKEGEIIFITGKNESGWWQGETRDSIGVFPSNLIKIVEDDDNDAKEITQDENIKEKGIKNNKEETTKEKKRITNLTDISGIKFEPKKSFNVQNQNNNERKRIKKKRETVKFEEPINYEEEDYDPFIEDHIGDPKAVALVDYTAKRNTELSFKEGEIIFITGKNESGWWQGETRDNIGVFPSNLIKIVEDDDNDAKEITQDENIKEKGIKNNKEETTKEKKEITNLTDISGIKFEPKKSLNVQNQNNNERKRIIKKKRETVKFEEPINYEEEDYDPFIEDHIGDPKAVALVDYTAKRNTELSFKEGEIIFITGKNESGWWQGETRDNIGVFPSNLIKIVEGDDNDAKEITQDGNIKEKGKGDDKKIVKEIVIKKKIPREGKFQKRKNNLDNHSDISGFIFTQNNPIRNTNNKPPNNFIIQPLKSVEENMNIGKRKKKKRVEVDVKGFLQKTQSPNFDEHQDDQHAQVLVDYQGEGNGAISLKKGEIIYIHADYGKGMVQAENKNGVNDTIPITIIEFIDKNNNVCENPFIKNNESANNKTNKERLKETKKEKQKIEIKLDLPKAKVLKDYNSKKLGQLSLKKNQIAYIHNMKNNGWFEVITLHGVKGKFPSIYLEFFKEEESIQADGDEGKKIVEERKIKGKEEKEEKEEKGEKGENGGMEERGGMKEMEEKKERGEEGKVEEGKEGKEEEKEKDKKEKEEEEQNGECEKEKENDKTKKKIKTKNTENLKINNSIKKESGFNNYTSKFSIDEEWDLVTPFKKTESFKQTYDKSNWDIILPNPNKLISHSNNGIQWGMKPQSPRPYSLYFPKDEEKILQFRKDLQEFRNVSNDKINGKNFDKTKKNNNNHNLIKNKKKIKYSKTQENNNIERVPNNNNNNDDDSNNKKKNDNNNNHKNKNKGKIKEIRDFRRFKKRIKKRRERTKSLSRFDTPTNNQKSKNKRKKSGLEFIQVINIPTSKNNKKMKKSTTSSSKLSPSSSSSSSFKNYSDQKKLKQKEIDNIKSNPKKYRNKKFRNLQNKNYLETKKKRKTKRSESVQIQYKPKMANSKKNKHHHHRDDRKRHGHDEHRSKNTNKNIRKTKTQPNNRKAQGQSHLRQNKNTKNNNNNSGGGGDTLKRGIEKLNEKSTQIKKQDRSRSFSNFPNYSLSKKKKFQTQVSVYRWMKEEHGIGRPDLNFKEFKVRVKYPFPGDLPQDLQLKKKEIITIIGKDDFGWLLGVNSKGSKGIFPKNFVAKI
ncbi:drebrin-like protein [Anaeramoeba flamelloides]|uniref:Drebrin-like protein n=1 Tax=Anaeramoeba flamelloides TaxID=1746091 RepID=A0AAV8ACN1_9EUKA|nr:drebrin-like protein [Anaeramoeba flamelloides]